MKHRSQILDKLAELKPRRILDVGCGCGCFTIDLAPYAADIAAIDLSPKLIEECQREQAKPNIRYRVMDARQLEFPDNSFDLTLERATLHHILPWEQVLDEMVRVSSRYILIEEPLDDPRSEEKRNTIRAQELFLDVQKEASYPHYKYLPLDSLTDYFEQHKLQIETKIQRSDKPVAFDQYFDSFEIFAERSGRKEYWLGRLDTLRNELKGKFLCESDLVLITAIK